MLFHNGRQAHAHKMLHIQMLTEVFGCSVDNLLGRTKGGFQNDCNSWMCKLQSRYQIWLRLASFEERWCNDYGKTQLSPKTYARYLALLKRINPYIGHIRLKDLQPNHLIELYNKLGQEQNMRGALYLPTKEFFERVAKKKLTGISISESSGLSANIVY